MFNISIPEPIKNTSMKFLQAFADSLVWIKNKFPVKLEARHLLVSSVIILLMIGMMMVTSASMPYTESIKVTPYYFVYRHLFAIGFAFFCAYFVYNARDNLFFDHSVSLYVFTVAVLFLVLFVGVEKNGSTRWLNLGIMNFQPSELAKVCMVVFMADYVVRRDKEVKTNFLYSAIRLFIAFGVMVGLIAFEPDLGSVVVIGLMALGVFFLAGAPLLQFISAFIVAFVFAASAILFKSYRLERLLSFTRPFEDQYGSGYQLSNSLMAYGLGEFKGAGLGQSIQKLAYLPEAHTDFMMAILGEELGFLGVSFVLIVSFIMSISCMVIGQNALNKNYLRAGYLAYGISLIFIIQIFVNVGMTLAIIPTKGLTLPFISYGGSSLWACAVMVAMVLQVDKKVRLNQATPDVVHEFNPTKKPKKKKSIV